jgi:hypothetical protein
MRFLPFMIFGLLGATVSFAQPKQNSPYSRYGLGDPVSQLYANQAGFGGQTMASHDPFHLNMVNPASLAHLRTTALEVGLVGKYSQYATESSNYNAFTGNLAYLGLGFTLKSPINEVLDRDKSPWRAGMGINVAPATVVGYDLVVIDTLPGLGAISNSFQGNGGTYRVEWGGAAQYKHTAFGAKLGWTFGKSEYATNTFVSDTFPTFQTNFRDDVRLRGLALKLGLQHDFILQYAEDRETPQRWVTVGLTTELPHQLRATADQLRLRSRGRNDNGTYNNADTLLRNFDRRVDVNMPGSFGIGVQYVKANKFKIGGQYDFSGWSRYANPIRPETFRNTHSASVGVEYIADYASYNRYLKRVAVRFGTYWRQDPRSVNGAPIDDIGLSLGAGFPLILPRQQTSFINLAAEIGRLGANTPIAETYYRLTVGFTLNDNTWFYKRRFE